MANETILQNAVIRLLKPLVKLLLRNGVSHAMFVELAKKAYVDTAAEYFSLPGKKQSDTRISTLTGLSRKEVARLRKESGDGNYSLQQQNRVARVVFGWVHDSRYQNEQQQCLSLPFENGNPSFSSLVKEYSGDMTPRAIYDELLLQGVIEEDDKGRIHLLQRAYIPASSEAEKLKILGVDVAGLISSIDRNIYETGKKPHFQRKVYYDNLPEEAIPLIKELINQRGQELLEEVNTFMAQYDRDANENVQGTGRRSAGLGLFYFEDEVKDKER